MQMLILMFNECYDFLHLGSDAAITTSLSNTAVLNGTANVTLSCASSLGYEFISWNYVPVGGSTVVITSGLTISNGQKPYYAIGQSGDQQNNLIILSATTPRAGTYYCSESGAQQASGQLIIISKLSLYTNSSQYPYILIIIIL